MMKKVRIYERGDWRYLLETMENSVVVWPYYQGTALAVDIQTDETQKNIAFRRVFPGQAQSKKDRDAIKKYCENFATDKKFRADEVRAFEKALKKNG